MAEHDITELLDLAGRTYSPDVPGGLANVKARAGRHKRVRGMASIGVALVVGAASVMTGILLVAPRQIPAGAARYLHISPATRIVNLSAPSNGLTDLYFADAAHGLGMQQHCSLSPTADTTCSLAIARTGDGGRTWTPVGQVLHVTYPDSRASYPFISFATNGKDGWIYGSKTFVTHDGGRTFEEDGPRGLVMDLSIVGNEMWALSRPCPPGTAGCTSTVYSVPVGGGPWHALRGAPKLEYPYLQLLRTSAKDALLAARATDGAISVTKDGGVSWITHPLPSLCAQLDHVTALSRHDVWVLCTGPAPSESQAKELFHSVDTGRTWVLTAASNAAPGVGTLPTLGIVTMVTSVAPARLWIALDEGPLLASTDGGRTWAPQGLPADGGVGQLTFTDALHGFAVTGPHDALYRTSDGGAHWAKAGSQQDARGMGTS